MLGMHGSRAANLAVQECDLLIVVGARFDDRATGKLAEFAPNARVVHMDIDACEIGKLRAADAGVRGDLRTTLTRLLPALRRASAWPQRWCAQGLANATGNARAACRALRRPWPTVYAPALLKRLSELAPASHRGLRCRPAPDVGGAALAHQRSAQAPDLRRAGRDGLRPARGDGRADCARHARQPCAQVICVSGDGSIMMNIQELATLRRYNACR
jgi:acetolactate synthase-1/2/3 large subunit